MTNGKAMMIQAARTAIKLYWSVVEKHGWSHARASEHAVSTTCEMLGVDPAALAAAFASEMA